MMWVAVIACAAVASLLFFAMVRPKISMNEKMHNLPKSLYFQKIAKIFTFAKNLPTSLDLLKFAKISIFSKCWQILPKCAFVFVGGGLYPHKTQEGL